MTDAQIEALKQDLFELSMKARREGKWLWTRYQNLWFSPDEIETEWREGKFLWGRVNWELRDPKDRLEQLIKENTRAHNAVLDFMNSL